MITKVNIKNEDDNRRCRLENLYSIINSEKGKMFESFLTKYVSNDKKIKNQKKKKNW